MTLPTTNTTPTTTPKPGPTPASLAAQGFTIAGGHLVVATGASCYPNGSPAAGAGIGFDWGRARMPDSEAFPAADTFPRDNVRAELFAVIRAIEMHPAPALPLLIKSGSEAAALAVHSVALWQSYGWRKRPSGGALANLDLLVRLHLALNAVGTVKVEYCKKKHPGKAAAKRAALRDYDRLNRAAVNA